MTLVYDAADPRLMHEGDLNAEHAYIHRLLDGDCDPNDPQYVRFDSLGLHGRSLLILRHEFIRVALAVRHGVTLHGREEHWTQCDHNEMEDKHKAAILLYERQALPIRVHRDDRTGDIIGTYRPPRVDGARYYLTLLGTLDFPRPHCTPWKEQGQSLRAYLGLPNRQTKGST